RGLDAHVWKRVDKGKVVYPDEESIEEPKGETVRRKTVSLEVKRRDEVVPRLREIENEMRENTKVEKKRVKKEPKPRLASPLRRGSSVSTSSSDSLSSILGHSLTMTSSSGTLGNFTGITSTSPTDAPSPNPSLISLDPFGKEKKCNCAHKPTTNISQAVSVDTSLNSSTADQSTDTPNKPLSSSPSAHSSISQQSTGIPQSFTDLCRSEYDSDAAPANDPSLSGRSYSSFASCNEAPVDDLSWYTVDLPKNRSRGKRTSRRKRKMKSMRPPIDIRSVRHSPQEDTINPAKAWAVIILMAIAVLAYRYSLPMCHGKGHHHH
ncbi:hypothetical protein PMAYCL1PPCAC_18489, partial [Pristionchus mayeri]